MEGPYIERIMMLNRIDKNEETLTKEISDLFVRLEDFEPHSKEYDSITNQIAKLYSIRTNQNKNKVSADTVVNATTHLLGILAILNYERLGVISSKALMFVTKMR